MTNVPVDDGDDNLSSDDEMDTSVLLAHSAELRIDLDNEEWATIVCRSLKADPEPSRSKAVRDLETDGRFLLIRVKSSDRRSLQKSLANLLDMCDLAKSTIDLTEKKPWIVAHPPPKNGAPKTKKPKVESNEKSG